MKFDLGHLLKSVRNLEEVTETKVKDLIRQEADKMLEEQFGYLNLDKVKKENLRKMLEEKIGGILAATSSIIGTK